MIKKPTQTTRFKARLSRAQESATEGYHGESSMIGGWCRSSARRCMTIAVYAKSSAMSYQERETPTLSL
jgi:hypothetical protein